MGEFYALRSRPAQGVRRRKFDILLVPQIAPQNWPETSTDSAGFSTPIRTRSPLPVERGQRPRSVQPASSSAVRTARAWPTAPALSPCRQSESTRAGERERVAPRSRRCRRAPRRPRSDRASRPVLAVRAGRGTPRATRCARPPRRTSASAPGIVSTGRSRGPVEHRAGLLGVVEHPVVERTVRLQVAHRRARAERRSTTACRPGRRPARAARRGRRHGPPGRSSPGRRRRPARRRRPRARPRAAHTDGHDRGAAGVVAAGDVGAGDDLEQGRVVGDLLAEVGVEVDVPGHGPTLDRRAARG